MQKDRMARTTHRLGSAVAQRLLPLHPADDRRLSEVQKASYGTPGLARCN